MTEHEQRLFTLALALADTTSDRLEQLLRDALAYEGTMMPAWARTVLRDAGLMPPPRQGPPFDPLLDFPERYHGNNPWRPI